MQRVFGCLLSHLSCVLPYTGTYEAELSPEKGHNPEALDKLPEGCCPVTPHQFAQTRATTSEERAAPNNFILCLFFSVFGSWFFAQHSDVL